MADDVTQVLAEFAKKSGQRDGGELDMVIKSDGSWWYQGDKIRRAALVRLFSSVLRFEEGRYQLVTPAERFRIIVEDLPFVLVAWRVVDNSGLPVIEVENNVGDTVLIERADQFRIVETSSGEPRPYVSMRNGLNARVPRSMFYQWVESGSVVERGGRKVLCIVSAGITFELGGIEE